MNELIQTKEDLLKYLEYCVAEYAPICKKSVIRNEHMNDLGDLGSYLHQKQIDAILVDFVNFIGSHQGLDWGMKTSHLQTEEDDEEDDEKQDEVNYVIHYKWQEGAELFFNRVMVKGFKVKDEDALTKLENRLLTILSNTGMEEESLSTVQITGITQL